MKKVMYEIYKKVSIISPVLLLLLASQLIICCNIIVVNGELTKSIVVTMIVSALTLLCVGLFGAFGIYRIFKIEKLPKFIKLLFLPFFILTLVYILLLVVNIPFLFYKAENKYSIPVVTKTEEENFQKIVELSEKLDREMLDMKYQKHIENKGKSIYSIIKDNDFTNKDAIEQIEAIREKYNTLFVDMVKNGEIARNKNNFKHLGRNPTLIGIFRLTQINLYIANYSLNNGKKDEAIKIVYENYDMLLKLMNMKSISYIDSRLINTSVGRIFDFIIKNGEENKIGLLKIVDEVKFLEYHKNMIKKGYDFEYETSNIWFSEMYTKYTYFMYPFFNAEVSKNAKQKKYSTINNFYGISYPERGKREKNIVISDFFINPLGNFFIKYLIGEDLNMNSKYDEVYNKAILLNYLVKNNGKANIQSLPIDIFSGEKFKTTKSDNNITIFSVYKDKRVMEYKIKDIQNQKQE